MFYLLNNYFILRNFYLLNYYFIMLTTIAVINRSIVSDKEQLES